MLRSARAKGAAASLQIPFVQADMRQFDLGGRFSTILIPGNSLLHLLMIEDLKQCFASVRRHLAPGGKLVFDVSNGICLGWLATLGSVTRFSASTTRSEAKSASRKRPSTTPPNKSVEWYGTCRRRMIPTSRL